MKNLSPLFLTMLLLSCKNVTLRKAVTGQVLDSVSKNPLTGVQITNYDGTQILAGTGSDGRFYIPRIGKMTFEFPARERDQLSPHSDKFCISKKNYKTDTIYIYQASYQTTGDTIKTGVIYLKP